MTTRTTPTRDEVMAEPAELQDVRIREVDERHGDDHAVNLTKLRAVAKRVDSAARLLALLISETSAHNVGRWPNTYPAPGVAISAATVRPSRA